MGVGFRSQNLASTQPLLAASFSSRYSAAVEPLAISSSPAHIGRWGFSVDFKHLNNNRHLL
jgi:hypothetical protein